MTLVDHKQFAATFSTEAICVRILEKHRQAVSIQKQHLAVANLARIIEAMLKLSNKQGFHATTLRELAQASDLSMGGLYSYIDTKNTLLLMILDGVSSTANEVLSLPPADLGDDPGVQLRWLIEAHIRLTEVMQPWFVFAYMEAKSFPPSARKMAVNSEEATEEIFAAVIRRGVDERVFFTDNPGLAASLIKPLLQDWYVKRSKYRRRGIDIESYISAASSFIMRALQDESPIGSAGRNLIGTAAL